MEINITRNGFGNIGLGSVNADFGMAAKPKDVKASKPLNVQSTTADALRNSEPVAEVPEAALSRDDALGNLVKAAFNLPPPAMPDFQNIS